MIVRFYRVFVVLILAAAGAAACDNGSVTTPSPAPTTTDTFTGTLAPNGATSYPFIVSSLNGGPVTATVAKLTPNTVPIGFSLGTWSDITGVCSAVMANDAAVEAAELTGRTSTVASLCLRVYDAGSIPADTTLDYTVTVVHP
jgi:hypothetical protein